MLQDEAISLEEPEYYWHKARVSLCNINAVIYFPFVQMYKNDPLQTALFSS